MTRYDDRDLVRTILSVPEFGEDLTSKTGTAQVAPEVSTQSGHRLGAPEVRVAGLQLHEISYLAHTPAVKWKDAKARSTHTPMLLLCCEYHSQKQ